MIKKKNLYQKLSNKNAAWCQLDGCVWLFMLQVKL